MTPTQTPVPPAYLLDTFEDGDVIDNYGGSWSTYAGAPNTISTVNPQAAGYPFSSYGYQFSGLVSGTNTAANGGVFIATMAASGTRNLSAYNYVDFYILAYEQQRAPSA